VAVRKQGVLRSGVAMSLAVHAIGLAALAAWSNYAHRVPAQFAGRQQPAILVTLSHPQWTPEAMMVELVAEPTVVIEPTHARIAKRQYTLAPSEVRAVPDVAESSASQVAVRMPSRATDRDSMRSDREASQQPQRQTLVSRRPTPAILRTSQLVDSSSLGNTQHKPPDLSHNAPPTYPALAMQRRWEGTVLLRLFIDENGQITDVQLMRSSGHAILDGAAANAVRRWTATPATRDGQPMATVEVLPVQFKLR
jgi:protein TonB